MQLEPVKKHYQNKRSTVKALVTILEQQGIRWASEPISEAGVRAIQAIAPFAASQRVRVAFGALLNVAPLLDSQTKLLRLGNAVSKVCTKDAEKEEAMVAVMESIRMGVTYGDFKHAELTVDFLAGDRNSVTWLGFAFVLQLGVGRHCAQRRPRAAAVRVTVPFCWGF